MSATARAFFQAQFRSGEDRHRVDELGAEVWFSATNQLGFRLKPGGTPDMSSVLWVINDTWTGRGHILVDHYGDERVDGAGEEDVWENDIEEIFDLEHSSILGHTCASYWKGCWYDELCQALR